MTQTLTPKESRYFEKRIKEQHDQAKVGCRFERAKPSDKKGE